MKRIFTLLAIGAFLLSFTAQTEICTADSTSTVDSEEIKSFKPVSITDALEFTLGVDVRQRAPMGAQSDISIRGGAFNQTSLIIDGVRWSSPLTGHTLFDIPIDVEDISSINVDHGFVGTGALTGPLNITTAIGDEDGSSAHLEFGSNGWRRIKATANLSTGDMRHRITYSSASSEGFVNDTAVVDTSGAIIYSNNDVAIEKVSYSGKINTDFGQINARLGQVNKEFGAPNFYGENTDFQFIETSAIFGQLSITKTLALESKSVDLFGAAYHRLHTTNTQMFREGEGFFNADSTGVLVMSNEAGSASITQPSNMLNNSVTRTSGGTISVALNSKLGVSKLYTDIRQEALASNHLGSDTIHVFEDSASFPFGENRITKDISFSQTIELGRLSLTGSVGTTHRNGDDEWTLLPGGSMNFSVDKAGKFVLHGSAQRTLRRATFNEMYFTTAGGQKLSPELSDNFEGGATISLNTNKGGKFVLDATYYMRQGQNLIDMIYFDDDNLGDTITSTTYEGVEYDFGSIYATNIGFIDYSGIETGFSYINKNGGSLKINYTTVSTTDSDVPYSSMLVNNYLSNVLTTQAQMNFPLDVKLNIRYTMQTRNSFDDEAEAVGLLYLTASRTFADKYNAYIGVNNLLNTDYVDVRNVQQPGRWLRAGVNFAF